MSGSQQNIKWVECVSPSSELTIGKLYEVIKVIKNAELVFVRVINNKKVKRDYFLWRFKVIDLKELDYLAIQIKQIVGNEL